MKKIAFIGILTNNVDNVAGPANSAKAKYIELVKQYGQEQIYTVSVYQWKSSKIKFAKIVGRILYAFLTCDNIIINVSYGAYKTLIKALYPFKKALGRKVHYFPVGNPNSTIKGSRSELQYLEMADYVYFQTDSIRTYFFSLGLTNGMTLYNFRHLNILTEQKLPQIGNDVPRICTFSRVSENKGILDAIQAVRKINEGGLRCELDIYGPIEKGFETTFAREIKNSVGIRYCGVAEPEKAPEILKNYYLLIFPSRFDGEGLPGTLLDAYAAGLPVVSSEWDGSREIVKDGKTGFIYQFCNVEDLTEKLQTALKNPKKIEVMKVECIHEAKRYDATQAMCVLYEHLV